MHLGIPALLDFYRAHHDDEHLVLAVIIGASGSTYRKPGAMMLLSADGRWEGLISGGCLESDLAHHAADVMASGVPRHLTYDMHADEDLVWNLGLGCDGVIQLLLLRIGSRSGFEFLDQLDEAQRQERPGLFALVVRESEDLPLGSLGFVDSSNISMGNEQLVGFLSNLAADWPDWRCRTIEPDGEDGAEVFVVHVPATPRVLLCGAGPDAVPLARALRELGWNVTVADHRPAFARAERFPDGCEVIRSRPEKLEGAVDMSRLSAAVVMSHHLENDGVYLRSLLKHDIPYLGVLGPQARREKLAREADAGERLVHGPVGLDIGAELPAAIALAVAAEIHAVLNRRDGRSLSRGRE